MSMFWPVTVIRIPSVRRWSNSNMAVIFHRDCAVLRFHRHKENATTIYRLESAYNNLHLQWIYRSATEFGALDWPNFAENLHLLFGRVQSLFKKYIGYRNGWKGTVLKEKTIILMHFCWLQALGCLLFPIFPIS